MNLKKILPRNIRGKLMDFLAFLPDKPYIKLFYFATTGKLPDLKNPVGFGEKQQWMKLYDRNPEYHELVDKLAVRRHVEKVLGEGYCFPLLGQWKSFREIDFSKLPESFVLKCNHDSGSTKVIRNKSALTERNYKELERFYKHRLKLDFYYAGREYPYKGLDRWIIAEQLMIDEAQPDRSIEDYKFFCFNGEPRLMFVATDRDKDLRFDFFDMEFNHLDIQNLHPNADKPIPKPACFEELKTVAAKLSKGMKFARVDLYEINGRIYFGEYTFYHGGGFCLFKPDEWEKRLGDWIQLG